MNNENNKPNNTNMNVQNNATKSANSNQNIALNKNFRKQNNSSSTNSLKKDTGVNAAKTSRIRNAFNNVKQRRAEAIKQNEIDETNLENEERVKKSKIAEVAEKKKKKIIAKIAASFFTSQVFLAAFGIIVVAVIFIMAIPILVSILSQQISDIWDNIVDGVTEVFTGYSSEVETDTIYPVKTTPLSRDEFIIKVNSYNVSSGKTKYYQVFKDNAGTIYDIGVREGVNPEFCVIRAVIEGFSPVANPKLSGDNNYWGIGCSNGKTVCKSYASFEKGVEGFYRVINSYGTENIYNVMEKYAYIGDKWYYPGSSGLGGCYYADVVIEKLNKLGFTDRAVEVRKTCDAGTQIPTEHDTDQVAYSYYQVEKNIIPLRQKIFGLGEESGRSSYKNKANLNIDSLVSGSVTLSKIQSDNVANILRRNGSSINDFNNQLLQIVKKDGVGTRDAVVDISKYTVNTFAMYGLSIPYLYYGGHYETFKNISGQEHNYPSSSYYGLNPYLGEDIYYNGTKGYTRAKTDKNGKTTYVTYTGLGLDCSGFVTWALHNGGINMSVKTSREYLNLPNANKHDATNTSEYIGKPGDVFACDGHVALNIKYVSGSDPYYIVIEEAGKGLAVNKYKVNGSYIKKYKIVDMSYYYQNEKTNNFEAAFKNGLIKYQ